MLAVKPNRSKASCDTIQTFIKSIVTLSVFKLTCFFSSGCRGFSLKLIKGINKNLHRIQIIIISTHYLFSDWPKVTMKFRNQHLGRHLATDYTIIVSRTLTVTDNPVMYDRGAWFLRIITSSSRPLRCLLIGIFSTRLEIND